uniref:hypothetical protein n=1 Tax=Vibrio paracholerae TaxID=650003 RepID=UPI001C681480
CHTFSVNRGLVNTYVAGASQLESRGETTSDFSGTESITNKCKKMAQNNLEVCYTAVIAVNE